MKFYIGVTDNSWYNYLRGINPEDINFWQPGGGAFKVIHPRAPFLFKLKSPVNAIGGVGFFSAHTFLPVTVAWDTFGDRNGCGSLAELQRKILNYRLDKAENPVIGCIVLTNPVFFKPHDWIALPADWRNSIVKGKSYTTREPIGNAIWEQVEQLIGKYGVFDPRDEGKSQLILEEPESPAYRNAILSRVRLGQGAFRVMVTDAYSRRCSISGERTLPVLEAAHIKPYALSGPHFISNALLLRSDMHKLFDTGYMTITKDYKVEISGRIKLEFENGKEYYKYHGKELVFLPERDGDKPDSRFIDWHNNHVFNE